MLNLSFLIVTFWKFKIYELHGGKTYDILPTKDIDDLICNFKGNFIPDCKRPVYLQALFDFEQDDLLLI